MCFPFRNTTCDLVSFIQPQRVRAGADGAAIQGSDRVKCNQAGVPLVPGGVCFLSIQSRSPGQPPEQSYNLVAGTKLPFALLVAKIPSAAHVSCLCLRKRNGPPSVRADERRGSPAIGGERQRGRSRAGNLPPRGRGRGSGACSADAAGPPPSSAPSASAPSAAAAAAAAQSSSPG